MFRSPYTSEQRAYTHLKGTTSFIPSTEGWGENKAATSSKKGQTNSHIDQQPTQSNWNQSVAESIDFASFFS